MEDRMPFTRTTSPSAAAPVQSPKTAFRRMAVVRPRVAPYSAVIEAGRTTMKSTMRLTILALAVAINAVAFSALNAAMVSGAERAVLANQEFDHVVVSATRTPADMAITSCPGTKAL
jgi:hypothetical protein